jgi:hypothetical protein
VAIAAMVTLAAAVLWSAFAAFVSLAVMTARTPDIFVLDFWGGFRGRYSF